MRLVAVLVASALLAACGLGDKQDDADAIVDGTKAAFASGTATGTIAVHAEVISVPDGLGAIGGVNLGAAADDGNAEAMFNSQAARPMVADVVFDFDAETAALTIPGQSEPFAVFDGLQGFGRRYNAGERDARPWVRVDLEDLAEDTTSLSMTEDSPFIGGFALNPVLLFDLAAGPLAGSIDERGTEQVTGATATRYEANFDIEKVLRRTRRSRYDEDRREAIAEALDVLSVKGTTHAGEVWLDDEGRPRRFTIRLREEPVKRFKVDLVITLDIASYGDGAAIDVPAPDERIEIDNVVQFLRSMIPPPTDPAFAAFLGIELPEAQAQPEVTP